MKLEDWVRTARTSVLVSAALALGYLLILGVQAAGSGAPALSAAIRDDLQIAGTVALIVFAVAAAVNWLFAQANLDELV